MLDVWSRSNKGLYSSPASPPLKIMELNPQIHVVFAGLCVSYKSDYFLLKHKCDFSGISWESTNWTCTAAVGYTIKLKRRPQRLAGRQTDHSLGEHPLASQHFGPSADGPAKRKRNPLICRLHLYFFGRQCECFPVRKRVRRAVWNAPKQTSPLSIFSRGVFPADAGWHLYPLKLPLWQNPWTTHLHPFNSRSTLLNLIRAEVTTFGIQTRTSIKSHYDAASPVPLSPSHIHQLNALILLRCNKKKLQLAHAKICLLIFDFIKNPGNPGVLPNGCFLCRT